jgi:hypothetical protein
VWRTSPSPRLGNTCWVRSSRSHMATTPHHAVTDILSLAPARMHARTHPLTCVSTPPTIPHRCTWCTYMCMARPTGGAVGDVLPQPVLRTERLAHHLATPPRCSLIWCEFLLHMVQIAFLSGEECQLFIFIVVYVNNNNNIN